MIFKFLSGGISRLLELIGRYRLAFNIAWKARKTFLGPNLLADEAAFLPRALRLQHTPLHPSPRRTAGIIMLLFSFVLTWSVVGELDIISTATGKIIVSQRVKIVQPLEAGVVKAIYVKDGDKVKAGQVLVELDNTAQNADVDRLRQSWAASNIAAMQAEALAQSLISNGAPHFVNFKSLAELEIQRLINDTSAEWNDLITKRARLEAERVHRNAELFTITQQIEKLKTVLPSLQQREQDFRVLNKNGFVSIHAEQDRSRDRIEIERDIGTLEAKKNEAVAANSESDKIIQNWRAEYIRTLRERVAAAELKSAELYSEMIKANQRSKQTSLTAPEAGVIQQLSLHTPGGVVTSAQVLMVIVPDDGAVSAEAMLDNRDIGFVHPGQRAKIKFDTFPYAKYGTISAEIVSISADSIPDEKRGPIFVMNLKLDKSEIVIDGRRMPLTPGMNLTAEINTGRRKVFRYFFDPLIENVDSSLRER